MKIKEAQKNSALHQSSTQYQKRCRKEMWMEKERKNKEKKANEEGRGKYVNTKEIGSTWKYALFDIIKFNTQKICNL